MEGIESVWVIEAQENLHLLLTRSDDCDNYQAQKSSITSMALLFPSPYQRKVWKNTQKSSRILIKNPSHLWNWTRLPQEPQTSQRSSVGSSGEERSCSRAPNPHPHPQNTARGWNRRAAPGPLRGNTKAQTKQVESTSYRLVHCLSWLRFLHVVWGLFVCFKEARGEIKFLLHSWSKKGCMYWNQNVSAALSETVLPAASSTSSWIPHR